MVRRRATYADLEALPEHLVGEIIDGDLIVSPRPAPAHARSSSSLGGTLHGPFDRGVGGPGGWVILDEPELHLGSDVLVPDLAGWRRERLPGRPAGTAFELAPDWVCEVLSPATVATDRARKLRVYAREAVGWVWLVDPGPQTLEVLELEAGSWRLREVLTGDAKARLRPFEAIELDLGTLWAW